MKIFSTLAAVALLSMSAMTFADAANRKVDIVNGTTKDIAEFYASNTGTDDWEEDILGQDVLAPDETFEADIDDGTGACFFDFKAVFSDGSSHIQKKVNVCKVSTFTYTNN